MVDSMLLAAISLSVISLLLFFSSLRRSGAIRTIAREVRAQREREQELKIKLDDLHAKLSNTVTQLSKQTHIVEKRLAQLEERLQKGSRSGQEIQLETEKDLEIADRLDRLEQVVLGASLAVKESAGESESSAEVAPETAAAPSAPAAQRVVRQSKPLEGLTKVTHDRLAADLRTISELKGTNPKKLCETVRKALKEYQLEWCVSEVFAEKVRQALESPRSNGGVAGIMYEELTRLLSESFAVLTVSPKKFEWRGFGHERGLRTFLLVGAPGSGKSTAAFGLAQEMRRRGAKVLLADCCVEVGGEGRGLSAWAEQDNIPIMHPLMSSKPHHAAYKAIHRAQDEKFDVVILDTPTALTSRNKASEDVTHIAAMIARELPYPPHETLLVLNAADTTKAVTQAQTLIAEGSFSGLVVTHADGARQIGILPKLSLDLGVGLWFFSFSATGYEFLPFQPEDFARHLFDVPVPPAPEEATPEESPDELRVS